VVTLKGKDFNRRFEALRFVTEEDSMRTMMTLLLVIALGPIIGCEKGRYTDDRHYIGDPERIPAASEPATGGTTVPRGVTPGGVRGTPPADPAR
jgi:hypothetical protein